MNRRCFQSRCAVLLLSGLVSAGPVFAAAPKAPLRIVSYNIHHGEGMDKKVDLKRIAKVIEAQHPDLVALQEVDKNCRRSGYRDLAKELGELLGMEYRFGKAIDLKGGEYGCAVLSRLPIQKTELHMLPESDEQRAALEVVVDHHGSPLSFVSVHLERNAGPQRGEQSKALAEILGVRQHPVFLAGDFNAARWEEPMLVLERNGWTVLEKNDGNDIRTMQGEKSRPDSATKERVEIDYVAVRGLDIKKLEHGVVQEFIASDHRPVYAIIK